MENAQELWVDIERHTPIVLTGLPMGEWAPPQKVAWCKTNLVPSPCVITCMRNEKQQFSSYGNILIDDNERSCKEWSSRGGDAVFHDPQDIPKTIKELNSIVAKFQATSA